MRACSADWGVGKMLHARVCNTFWQSNAVYAHLQKRCFAIWFLLCGMVTVAALRSSDVAHTELFYIYFQPVLPVLTMLWLWGVNVRCFEKYGVRYDVCFSNKDQKFLPNSRQIFQVGACDSDICNDSLTRPNV